MSTVSSRSVSKGSDFEQVYASPIVLQLSGADEESIARHSRKRRERAFSDEDGKLAEDGRKRRSRGSSDENGTIGWVGFVNEDLRVGGPILCPLPLEISRLPPSHPLFQRLCSSGSPILGQVSSTIRSHGISYQQLSVCLQTYKFRPQDGSTVTISIIAKREQKDEQWRRAARAAQTYLKGVGLTQVAVEIADPQAFVPNHISPVRPGAKIYNRWSSVRDAITNEIDLADVKVIGCYRFGKSRTPRDNSITVIVIVDINSTRSWESARERIVKILARFELPMVAVSIFKDIIQRGFKSPVETLTEESLHGPALLGRSLGPAGEDNGTGTLGGFLNLKDPAGKWHTFGLTCFHCILPSNTRVARSSTINRARFLNWKLNGISMSDRDREGLLRLDHPTIGDMTLKLAELHNAIEKLTSDPEFKDCQAKEVEGLLEMMPRSVRQTFLVNKRDLQDLLAFARIISQWRKHNTQDIGYVAAASGFRRRPSTTLTTPAGRPRESCLDWALINVKSERMGTNTLMKEKILHMPTQKHFEKLPEMDLFIEGCSSGRSMGQYSSLADVHVSQEVVGGKTVLVETIEHSIVGSGDHFSTEGDSGATVHTAGGHMIGLLFGGAVGHNLSYFTHVLDLFADITRATGATDIRLVD